MNKDNESRVDIVLSLLGLLAISVTLYGAVKLQKMIDEQTLERAEINTTLVISKNMKQPFAGKPIIHYYVNLKNKDTEEVDYETYKQIYVGEKVNVYTYDREMIKIEKVKEED